MATKSIFELASDRGCFWCGDERIPKMHDKCRRELEASNLWQNAIEDRRDRAADNAAWDAADAAIDADYNRVGNGEDDPDWGRSPL